MDVHESAEGKTVTASFELPGLKKEDVRIDVHQGRLTVSGESADSFERAEHGFAIRERRFGQFSRTIQLPQGIKVRSTELTFVMRRDTDICNYNRRTRSKHRWRMVC
jgi:HSP20 family protein